MRTGVIICVVLGCIALSLLACAPSAAPGGGAEPQAAHPAEAPAAAEPAKEPIDLNEPNNVCLSATSLQSDKEMVGAIDQAGDEDIYQIRVKPEAPATITLKLRHPEAQAFDFAASIKCQVAQSGSASGSGEADFFMEPSSVGPATSDEMGKEVIVTFNVTDRTGLIYLKVMGEEDFASDEPYTMQVEMSEMVGELSDQASE